MPSCRNCFDNCDEPISDKCVRYTGDTIASLGIDKGDQLSLVEAIVLSKLLSALDGTGITPKDVTIAGNDSLKALLGFKPATLNNLIQALIDNQTDIEVVLEGLGATTPFVFNTRDLELPDSPSRDDIIQALIDEVDSLTKFAAIADTKYVKVDDLETLVTQIVEGETTETTTPVGNQQYLKMVPGVLYPYIGSLSNFDSTGKGLASTGFDKVYLYNGLNSTADARGRALVGAVKNVPGASLDSAVDPLNLSNAGWNPAVGDKFGKNTHKLEVAEMPSHSHVVNDPGHKHNTDTHLNDTGISSQPNGLYNGTDNNATNITITSKEAFTNISVNATGGGQAHNNIQPSIAVLYITYLP